MVRIYFNGKGYDKLVHRLVAEAFIPNPLNKPQVNHKRGVYYGDSIYNLEWVTQKENIQHAYANGFIVQKCGEDHIHKYSKKKIKKICKLLMQGLSNKDICKILNVPKHLVSDIKNKRVWKSVVKDYEFPKKKNYSDEFINDICKLIDNGNSTKEIKKKLNLPNIQKYNDLIKNIKNNGYYSYISKNYKFYNKK